METKTCAKCKIEKNISEFYKEKRRKDGINIYCKNCIYILKSKYRSKYTQSDKGKKTLKEYRSKTTIDLEDTYIKQLIYHLGITSYKNITPEIIELKRISLLNKRIIKNKSYETK